MCVDDTAKKLNYFFFGIWSYHYSITTIKYTYISDYHLRRYYDEKKLDKMQIKNENAINFAFINV